jgi:hypothetical protein
MLLGVWGQSRCLHQVLTGAEELGSFGNPNQAIDFTESTVREQRAIGSLVELVDPTGPLER